MNRIEFRIKDVQIDCTGDMKVGGYVNVTERESETLYSQTRGKWFKEVMKKGVFQKALQRNKSVPCLLEHNWENVLAHTDEGSLTLVEDNIGLRFDAVINNPEVYEQVRNGQINSCSFGFRVRNESVEPINQRLERRYVSEIELLEVSLVKNPAYTGSLVEQRNLELALQEDAEKEVEEVVEEIVEDTVEEVIETTDVAEEDTVEETPENVQEEVQDEVQEDEQENRGVEEIEPATEEVKEVIEEVIEQKEQELQIVEECTQSVKEYKEELIEDIKDEVEYLEQVEIGYIVQSLKLKSQILKLKQVNMSL